MGHIRTIEPANLGDALRFALADGITGRLADARRVRGFEAYLRDGNLDWRGWWALGERGVAAVGIAALIPGRTAILLSAPPGVATITPADQADCVRHVLAELAPLGLHYAQALVEPGAPGAQLLTRSGFQRLTTLRYLGRDVRFPWSEPVGEDAGNWTAYSDERAAEFGAVIRASYEASRDCPELTGLRPIRDVLASHRASGRFDPDFWQLFRSDGQDRGCLLLTPLGERRLAEITYLGVPAAQRGRGVGGVLVRRALEFLRRRNFERLTLVVDARNDAALRLYAAHGFTELTQRDAYVWIPSTAAPRA